MIEDGLVDIVESELQMHLIPYFDEVSNCRISNVNRCWDRGKEDAVQLHFNATVKKYGESRVISMKVLLTPLTITYPSIAYSQLYGIDFNINNTDIDACLYPFSNRKKPFDDQQLLWHMEVPQ